MGDDAIVTLAVENFGKPEESARRIVREAFAKSAADNVTAVVVEFQLAYCNKHAAGGRPRPGWPADTTPAEREREMLWWVPPPSVD